MKDELDGKNNEIQNQSLQLVDLIDQISNENDEIMSLRIENESLKNDLDTEKQINGRMMKSQADMNQLHEQTLHRKKGKEGIGYKEEGKSSKQGAQKNPRPT